jgi:flavodoxin I
MNILIAYATYSSGTEIVAHIIAETLRQHNHTITIKKISEINLDEFTQYECILLGSPSWDAPGGKDGQPHQDFLTFIETHPTAPIDGKKCAIFGLGDATYARFCYAVNYLEEYISKSGGNLIIPSLKIDGFYFDQKKNMVFIKQWAEQLTTHL